MTATLDEISGNLAKLTQAIQEKTAQGANPKTELKWDDLKKDFEGEIDALVAAQLEAKMASMPQRPGVGGDPILSPQAAEHLKGNRYAKMVRDFERDGVHKYGGQTLRPVDLLIAAHMLDGQAKHYHANLGGGYVEMSDDLRKALKAMDSTTSGSGDELVPTNLAAMLWDDIFLASRVAASMQRIDMPTNPFDIPLGLGAVTWRKGSENNATSEGNPGTAKSTLTATELVTEQRWSYTLDEDAVIAMAPAIRGRLAQSGAEIIDSFVLNADATAASSGNINSDDATPAADSYFLADGQDGVRHQWLVDNSSGVGTDENGALADATLTAEMAAMGKYAADPSKLMMACDVGTYLNGFLATGTGSPGENVITLDKFGQGAVVMTGQLAAYRGIPIVVSASHPLTAADGKADAATPANNTKGSISIINRMMWYVGFKRNILIETDRDIQRRQYIMVTSLREAVAAHGTRSTNTHTGGIYNITI